MAEENPYRYDETTETPPARRPPFSIFTLIVGVATLLVSAYVLSDGATWLPPFDLRWALAGGAVLIGMLMLGASLRNNRRD